MGQLIDAAIKYSKAGISVIATGADKMPARNSGKWGKYNSAIATELDINHMWASIMSSGVAIIGGPVSGNTEVMDFDFGSEFFGAFRDLVNKRDPHLLDKLVLEATLNLGIHLIYRKSGSPVPGNTDLAFKRLRVPGPGIFEYQYTENGQPIGSKKELEAEEEGDGGWYIYPCMIETRGTGGYAVCDPSPGYSLRHGKIEELPTLTEDEYKILWECAKALDQKKLAIPTLPKSFSASKVLGSLDATRPGDDFVERRGEIVPVLERHGWKYWGEGNKGPMYTRPGKDVGDGPSATLIDGQVLYVFTSNASPFKQRTGYSIFSVYGLLEHGGDFSAAAKALSEAGYGTRAPFDNYGLTPGAPSSVTVNTMTAAKNEAAAKRQAFFDASWSRIRYPLKGVFKPAEEPPPYVIQGVARKGEKAFLNGPSKAGKTFAIIQAGIAVATGKQWLGLQCNKGKVLYVDFESRVDNPATGAGALDLRIRRIVKALNMSEADCNAIAENIEVRSMRGTLASAAMIAEKAAEIGPGKFDLCILDPNYKMLAGLEENASSDMAELCGCYERVANSMQCLVMVCLHYAKGNASQKQVEDRVSGSGVLTRDPDVMINLTPHEEADAYVVSIIAREEKRPPEFVVKFTYPIHQVDATLDPKKLRQPKARNKPEMADFLKVIRDEMDGKVSCSAAVDHLTEIGVGRAAALQLFKEAKKKLFIEWAYKIAAGSKGGKPVNVYRITEGGKDIAEGGKDHGFVL